MMRKALGRGLEALLPEHASVSPAGVESAVAVSEIVPNPDQPRRHFDEEALASLAESIRRHGLLQPLVVRRIAGRFELIAGERRLQAAKRANLESVPVIVREARPEDRLELALIENLQRENLTPLEEAEAYRHLMDAYGLTQEEIAQRVGKSRPAITNTLRLLALPDAVKAQLEGGELSAGHARAVLSLEDAQGRWPSRARWSPGSCRRAPRRASQPHGASARRSARRPARPATSTSAPW